MKRVVITGLGIISCLGNDVSSVTNSLRQGRSGIKANPSYKEKGLRSQVSGSIDIDLKEHIDRKNLRFMGDAAAFSYLAMKQAIEDAHLTEDMVSNSSTGLIAGSGGASSANLVLSADILRSQGIKKVGPFMVPRTMSSTISACLSNAFKIKGLNYSVTSACATSTHCIGNAFEQIQTGRQNIVFAGGGDEEDWTLALLFDAMGALSSKYNETPDKAARAYDAHRDGFVIAGGAGMLVLEELDHAVNRGARIYAEVTGYGATSDGHDMVAPSGEGAVRCMQLALGMSHPQPIDYINAHGTSTPVGDLVELRAIKSIFGNTIPPINSTKSMSGHSLGAAGVHEAIYTLLQMEHSFIAPSINIEHMEEEATSYPIITSLKENISLKTVMTNNFGFGGTNACLVFQKFHI